MPRQRKLSAWLKSSSHSQRETTSPHGDQRRVFYTYVEIKGGAATRSVSVTWPYTTVMMSNRSCLTQTPDILLPKLLGELRTRYLNREGGYTRVVRTESKNEYDQGESAILEFVDGPKDSRFMMTAKTVARDRMLRKDHTPVTNINVKKVTQFRGIAPFEEMVKRFMVLSTDTSTKKDGKVRDEGSLAEVEAEKASEGHASKAKQMADAIVPDSVKNAAQLKDAKSPQ